MSRRVAFLWGSNANTHYPTLKYAQRDVKRLRDTLSSSRYGFEVITPPGDSTPYQIAEALDEITSSCTLDDVFVGYFSGHGQLVKSTLYLVLDRSVPGRTPTMFPSTRLIEALQNCHARHRLFILDCCHAGAATGEKSVGVGVDVLIPKERILYASDKLERARELEKLEGSFLTHRLCKLLAGAPPGEVALTRVVDALQRSAHEHNQHAPLLDRVPVPYLSGEQKDEFYFSTAAAQREDPTPPPFEVDEIPGAPRRRRRGRIRRVLASAWLGLRSAASDGQGSYFFTMLALGLAAFFFHDSLQIQHVSRQSLQDNLKQPQAQLRAARYPTFEGLLLPDRTELCRNKRLVAAVGARLDDAYSTFAKLDGSCQQLPDFSPFLTSDITSDIGDLSSDDAYHITSLYCISSKGVINSLIPHAAVNPLADGLSGPSGDGAKPESFCDYRSNQANIDVTSTSPYFDFSGHGIIETICYQSTAPPKEASPAASKEASPAASKEASPAASKEASPAASKEANPAALMCIDLAISEAVIFSHLKTADAALGISTVQVPISEACMTQLASCDETSLPGTREKDDYSITSHHLKDIMRNHEPSGDAKLRAIDARGVWPLDSGVLGAVVFHQPKRTNVPERWDFVIARIRKIQAPNYFSLSLSAISLISAVIILVRGARHKLKRQQSLLARGLPYGMLELKDGKIIGANDRAEDILQARLPRLGTRSAQIQIGGTFPTFAPMINDVCVLLPSHGGAPSNADICSYDGKIRDRANDGLTSVFYAWVNRTRTWIKVTATVILLPSGTEHVFCVLDTAIDLLYKDLLGAAHARSSQRSTGEYASTAD